MPHFNTTRNGYDQAEVDTWVSAIQQEKKDLEAKLAEYGLRLEELEQLQRQADERVGNVMTRAQAAADLALHEARMEADQIRNNALEEAKEIHMSEVSAATKHLEMLNDQAKQTEKYLDNLQEVITSRVQAARESLQQALNMLQNEPGRIPVERKMETDFPAPARPTTLSELVDGAIPEPRDGVLDVLGG